MITNLHTKNFRAFEELNLNFSKVNLFFGPNNAGKSSILSALIILSQTLKCSDGDVPILLTGDGVMKDFGTYGDLVFKNETKREITISLGFNTQPSTGKLTPVLRGFIPKEGINGNIKLEYKYRPKKHKIILKSCEVEMPLGEIAIKTKYIEHSEKPVIETYFKRKKELPQMRMNNFSPQLFFRKFEENSFLLDRFIIDITDHLRKIEYIGPFRESPNRIYPFSGESPAFAGEQGKRAVEMLAEDYYRRRGKKKIDLAEKVSNWFKESGIAEEIYVKRLTEKYFEVILTHIYSKEKENLVDVGFGCGQVLPILVAGYNLKPDHTLVVEQPEIHLHPKAQAELGTFFKDLALNDIQLFIETHSEHLLLRLQSYVASGDLKPEDVKVYYVYSNKDKDGKKETVELPLNDKGYFSKEWPEGFFPERLNEAIKIEEALSNKSKKNGQKGRSCS